MGSITDNFINAVADLSVAWMRAGGRSGTQLRFGQYVMNSKLDGLPQTWPELFYAEDYNKAYALLYAHAHNLND